MCLFFKLGLITQCLIALFDVSHTSIRAGIHKNIFSKNNFACSCSVFKFKIISSEVSFSVRLCMSWSPIV